MKHFSPRLKEMAIKSFMAGDGIPYIASFYETTTDKIEAAIRAKLLEDQEALKRVAEKFVDNVFDGRRQDLP